MTINEVINSAETELLTQKFDDLIPQQRNPVTTAPFQHTRISISTEVKKTPIHYACENDHKYAKIIFVALAQTYLDVQVYPKKYHKSTLQSFSNALVAFIRH